MRVYSARISDGARELAAAMGVKRIKRDGGTFRGNQTIKVINWGSTNVPANVQTCTIINQPDAIRQASNKLAFFRAVRDLRLRVNDKDFPIIPWYTDNRDMAVQELRDNGGEIVCRTVVSGSGGEGIVIARSEEQVVQAPLYTRYIPKNAEYRIHLMRTRDHYTIIDMQEKARRHDHENPNWQVRNHENGFIYKRQDINVPDCVKEVAKLVMPATDLDFGAVDVIYNAKRNRAYVLEVNTAPGLEGQTVQSYADAFRRYYE